MRRDVLEFAGREATPEGHRRFAPITRGPWIAALILVAVSLAALPWIAPLALRRAAARWRG